MSDLKGYARLAEFTKLTDRMIDDAVLRILSMSADSGLK